MDGLKLNRWRDNFNKEVANLQLEYNSFFLNKKLEEYYQLKIDDTQNLSLVILNNDELPKELENRLMKILSNTKPEDSV